MKNLFILMLLAACGIQESVILKKGLDGQTGRDGIDGVAGTSGLNGHSLVSEFSNATPLECPNGGNRTDIFIDMDDSFSVSTGDYYSNSLVACNGFNGAQGAQGIQGKDGPQGETGPTSQGQTGPQGPVGATGPMGPSGSGATVVPSTSTCTQLVGNFFTKNNVLYLEDDLNHCDGTKDKVELNSLGSLWLSASQLAVFDGTLLRIINFN